MAIGLQFPAGGLGGDNMKKIIEANDLHMIADEILHNVLMLELADSDTAEDDLLFYVPRIKRCAEDLKGIAKVCEPAPVTQGGAADE